MKHLLIPILLILLSSTATAVPAQPGKRTITQPDGTTITVTMRGDENGHRYFDEDGDMLVEDTNGFYRKATTAEISAFDQHRKSRINQRNKTREARLARIRGNASMAVDITSYKGNKRGLVILINFNDVKFNAANTSSEFNDMFNKEGYNKYNHVGSVRDYFLDQSYGALDITFDVFGPVTVQKNSFYYGRNDALGDDSHAAEMVIEACRSANLLYPSLNFSNYDWNGDGEVDQVFLIYAGNGEHSIGASSSLIWPHEWTLESAGTYGDGEGIIKLDGVRINTYAVCNELAQMKTPQPAGIGTACHEFSHCLGLPDIYNTEYSGGTDMDYWDLMDTGSYNGPTSSGECPCGFTAYERWQCGWISPTILSAPTYVQDMPALNDNPAAYVIYNDGSPYECFLLENRQDNKWFKYNGSNTGAHGMLVTHIDYNREAWQDNTLNNSATRKRYTYIPANCRYQSILFRAQLFPGPSNVTELTNTSHYNYGAKLNNLNTDGTYYMNKPITDIEEKNGMISFSFMGGAKSGIYDMGTTDSEAPEAEYFTLNGLRINAPTTSGIYLRRNNGKTTKIYR